MKIELATLMVKCQLSTFSMHRHRTLFVCQRTRIGVTCATVKRKTILIAVCRSTRTSHKPTKSSLCVYVLQSPAPVSLVLSMLQSKVSNQQNTSRVPTLTSMNEAHEIVANAQQHSANNRMFRSKFFDVFSFSPSHPSFFWNNQICLLIFIYNVLLHPHKCTIARVQ